MDRNYATVAAFNDEKVVITQTGNAVITKNDQHRRRLL